MLSQYYMHQSIFAPFLVQMKLFGSTKTTKHAQLWEASSIQTMWSEPQSDLN